MTLANKSTLLPGTRALYSAVTVRALDAAVINAGVPSYALMCQAAAAALRALRARWSVSRDLLVLCGGGNNGGDGFALARLAKAAGLAPTVVAFVPLAKLRGDALRAAEDCRNCGVPILDAGSVVLEEAIERCDVIVDALLGIGVVDAVRADLATAITCVNQANRPVVSLDLPSGLCADSGRICGVAVRADLTVTFVARKAGLYLGDGPDCCGELVLDALGADDPRFAAAVGAPMLNLLDESVMQTSFTRRARQAHKGDSGHVLIVGGGNGMPGAARLAGDAALRAGAGRVTVATAADSLTAIAAGRAELMVRAVQADASFDALLAAVDAIAIGPGLGQDAWAEALFRQTLAVATRARLPLVIDADALNLLARMGLPPLPAETVLTPHPGEAARLLGGDAAAVQRDRLDALSRLQSRSHATVVLKGAGSLVSDTTPWICAAGNPAMAAPGMGDVLTGVIGALLAQGVAAAEAARVGVLWHALAGDAAARGDRGLLAGEVAAHLPVVLERTLR